MHGVLKWRAFITFTLTSVAPDADMRMQRDNEHQMNGTMLGFL